MALFEDTDHNGTSFDEGLNLACGFGGAGLAALGTAGAALGTAGVGLSGIIGMAGPETWPIAAAIGLPSLALGLAGGGAMAAGGLLAASGAGATEVANTAGDFIAPYLGLGTPVAPGTPGPAPRAPSLADVMNPFGDCY